jgi:glycosyltransferase involved in cell wall biosynthesis
MLVSISVIIATYNRCESLKDTLNSLLAQEGSGSFDYEILVIDNNSKDKTKEVVESYLSKFNGKIRYLFEPKQGKTFALNRAIKEAKGEILAFTDDDVIIDKEWLLNIFECFKKYDCDGIGGRILPLYLESAPKWVKDNRALLGGPIANYDYGKDTQIYNNNFQPFVGSNMSFKKYCFDKVGLFRTDFGPGTAYWSDDTEFFMRVEAFSKNLYYCGKALVWHKINRKMMSYKYLAKWYIRAGRFRAKQNTKRKDMICYFGIPRYIFGELAKSKIMLIFNLFKTGINIGQIIEFRRIKTCQK